MYYSTCIKDLIRIGLDYIFLLVDFIQAGLCKLALMIRTIGLVPC